MLYLTLLIRKHVITFVEHTYLTKNTFTVLLGWFNSNLFSLFVV
jgi:hypothetical protein